MADVKLKYEKVGHIIMLEEDDWKRIVNFMQIHGMEVEETPNKACSRRVQGCGAKVVKSKSKVRVGRTRGWR